MSTKQNFQKFGLASTYNPFANNYPSGRNIDITINITQTPPFADAQYICISLGLIPEINKYSNGAIVFTIIKNDGTSVILNNRVGTDEIGDKLYPAKTDVVWFDISGLQGDYFIHSDYTGCQLNIKGEFMASAIPAWLWNDLVDNTNNDIATIQSNLNNQIDTLKSQRLKIIVEEQYINWNPSVWRTGSNWNTSYTYSAPSGTIGMLGIYLISCRCTNSWDKLYFPYTPGVCYCQIESGNFSSTATINPSTSAISGSASGAWVGYHIGGNNYSSVTVRAVADVGSRNNGSLSMNAYITAKVWWLKQVNY